MLVNWGPKPPNSQHYQIAGTPSADTLRSYFVVGGRNPQDNPQLIWFELMNTSELKRVERVQRLNGSGTEKASETKECNELLRRF